MAPRQLTPEKLRAAATELERGLYNHEQWFDALIGTLVCRLPADERDVNGDAHHKCRLGQWYYSGTGAAAELHDRPGFVELGTEHEQMHHWAAKMLSAQAEGQQISLDDYERFVSSLKRMRMELLTLKHDVEGTLHALDPLTGIQGRVGLLTRLREQQALVDRGVEPCCLAILDLDHFKSVNDTYGHSAGDAVLIAFAHHMAHGLRSYDKVFRYGGEEFLVVLPGTPVNEGFEAMERLRNELSSLEHDVRAKEPLRVTASFGLSPLEPGQPVEEAIERADKALYAAKAAGRNRSVVWNASLNADDAATRQSSAA